MELSSSSSSIHLYPRAPQSTSISFSSSFTLLFRLPHTFRPLEVKPYCSSSTVEQISQQDVLNANRNNPEVQQKKKTRKPKPSFYDQIREKWSSKPKITTKLPWRQEGVVLFEQEDEEKEVKVEEAVETKEVGENGEVYSSFASELGLDADISFRDMVRGGSFSGSVSSAVAPWDRRPMGTPSHSEEKIGGKFSKEGGNRGMNKYWIREAVEPKEEMAFDKEALKEEAPTGLSKPGRRIPLSREKCISATDAEGAERSHFFDDYGKFMVSDHGKSSSNFPWVSGINSGDQEGGNIKKSNTDLADSTIPEHELKRLRNIALRMVERTKVGEAGVTSALVDTIREKWKIHEVVKLKFEGSPSLNMRRTHEILERKTGGLVIWRSGSSVVLFRGLNYNLDCVQSYNKQSMDSAQKSENSRQSSGIDSLGRGIRISERESTYINELDDLLDNLGPRFVDWTGGPRIPVDADLLQGLVSTYKRPFRLLPHGTRRCLSNKQMTFFRRQARRMPPHFALGKNKELQGLAAAMVKLWERSAIAKIAIKHGVLNTCNDKMAEDLKELTGGILVSRNKEYIVFYRGNDFLPPAVTEALKERERVTGLQHQEEEAIRDASVVIDCSNFKPSKVPMVAGTLAETIAATSHWGKEISNEYVKGMLKESAVAKHASLVKYLEKKLALGKEKMKKAENALAKVQEYLEPAELPSDLEYITDEERFLYRKMGHSMKPFLVLGRRGVFDGTIENMHLHWKFRELVKIIVKGKTFALVKHIAISLEAESGGILVSIDKTLKGYAIILYRGKNYQKPLKYRPRNLLTRQQALARSIELQRREALNHHIKDLQERIDLINSELDDMIKIKDMDDKAFVERLDNTSYEEDEHDSYEDEEGEEAYLIGYPEGDENVLEKTITMK